eukprot:jgi/Orpsp1_1/1185241/evm.model.c7180000092897.1
MRNILLSYPVLWNGNQYKKISELYIPNYSMERNNNKYQIYKFISQLYDEVPSYEESINIEKYLWNDDNTIDYVDIKKCVELVSGYSNITTLEENIDEDVWEWLNSFLSYIKSYHPNYLESYAIIPNMNEKFVRLNKSLATSINVPDNIIECLESLDINWKDLHISRKITKYSPGTDHNISYAVSEIRKNLSIWSIKYLTLMQYIPYDCKDSYDRKDEIFIQKRKSIYELCSVIFNKNFWYRMKDGSGFPKYLWDGIDEMVFDKLLLKIQEFKEVSNNSKVSVRFINHVLECYSKYFSYIEINDYSVIPNQNGKLCSTDSLYKDMNIPEIFKDCLNNCFEEDIRKSLLHKEIKTTYLRNIKKKEIHNYKSTLKNYFSMSEEPTYNRYSRSYTKYVSLASKKEAAKYLIKIVPNDSNCQQRKLFNLYQVFTQQTFSKNEYCEIPNSEYIYDLWDCSNKYIYEMIREIIEKSNDVHSLAIYLGKNEKEILRNLNIYINNFPINGKIVPNQYGKLCEIKKLMNEGNYSDSVFLNDLDSDDTYNSNNDDRENIKYIPEELKDIAKCLGYDIKASLVHKSIGRPCSRNISYEDICKKIDNLMEEKHKNKATYVDPKFKKGAYKLIEKYFKKITEKERKKLFPYSSSVKSNIIIDVVIDENARETLVNIRNKYDDDEIKKLQIYSDKVKELLRSIDSNKNISYSFIIGSGTNSSYGYSNSYSKNKPKKSFGFSYSYSNNNEIMDEIYDIIYKILYNSGEFKDVTWNSNDIEVKTFDNDKYFIKI